MTPAFSSPAPEPPGPGLPAPDLPAPDLPGPRIALVLGSYLPPSAIVPIARLAEDLGFAELWFSEDCFYAAGIAGATAALAATRTLPLGLGIVSASTRHPAILAMELATVDVLFPGRIVGGIGHGVPAWLDQMGVMPAAPLAALRQSLQAVRRLLDGEEVTESGPFHFDGIALTHPATTRVPLYTGVIGRRGLRLSGAVADGTVLSTLASPAYVEWARAHVAAGAAAAGREGPHRMVTYTLYSVAADPSVARAAIREPIAFYLAALADTELTRVYGIAGEVADMLAAGGIEGLARDMPDAWVDDLAVAGDPEECVHKLRRLHAAGSDTIGLWCFPAAEAAAQAELTAREVLPRL